jgi:hypothetical protein
MKKSFFRLYGAVKRFLEKYNIFWWVLAVFGSAKDILLCVKTIAPSATALWCADCAEATIFVSNMIG